MKLLGLWHSIDATQHNRRLFAKVNEMRIFLFRCVAHLRHQSRSLNYICWLSTHFDEMVFIFDFCFWANGFPFNGIRSLALGFFRIECQPKDRRLEIFCEKLKWLLIVVLHFLLLLRRLQFLFESIIISLFLAGVSFFSFQFHYHVFSHARASFQTETVDKRWGFTGAHVDWLPLPIRSLLKNILFCPIFI